MHRETVLHDGGPARSPARGRRLVPALFVIVLAAVRCAAAVDAEGGAWKVGVARARITPTEFMWMSGYASRDRPADGTLTDLWAKALAIEDSAGARHVLITLDLVGIDSSTSAAITQAVMAEHGLPREALAISTSHTHSGPVVRDNLRAMYTFDDPAWALVRRYSRQLRESVVGIVGAALADLRPAEVSWTVGRARFAVNRRNNPEKDVPERRAADRLAGPVDHDVPVLVVREPGVAGDAGVRAVAAGYACHATVLSGYQWSGDWPGYAQLELERRFPQATALVWIGCGADQNPLPRRTVELAERYGADLAAAVAAAMERRLVPVRGRLAAVHAEIPLAYAALPTRDDLERATSSTNRFEAARARLLLDAWQRDGGLPTSYPYPVQTWRLGDGPHWIFLGGEVVVDFAVRLKSELGCGRTWVAGYCNDVMAYVASRRVLAEGGYEGGGAMVYYGLPSPWAPSSEDAIVAAVRAQVAATGGVAAAAPRTIAPREYPDHADVGVVRDEAGEGVRPIATAADWARRRADVLDGMQAVMGRLPDPAELGPLVVTERGREQIGDCTRVLLTYSAGPGRDVTAHLYLPGKGLGAGLVDGAGRRPALLALHPTSPLGKLVVAGEGPRANRGYAIELAGRGYVVLAPDYPSFGELADYDFHMDEHASGTMAAIVNHRRGVDLLAQRPDVDPDRIGAIGHSLGGHNAIFVAVFDPRIKAVVSSCGWDPFRAYKGGRLAGWAQDRYMQRVRDSYGCDPERMPFDFPEAVAAIAPRGCFTSSPLGDDNFSAPAVAAAAPAIRRIYDLLGADDRFVLRQPDCVHDFPADVREEAYAFLDRVIGGRSADAAGAAASSPAAGHGAATPDPARLQALFARHRPFRPEIRWLPDGAGVRMKSAGDDRWVVVDAASGARREEPVVGEPGPGGARVLEPKSAWGRSPAGGAETEIVLVNGFDRPIRIFWADFSGRPRPYGTLAPGAERRQHTFAGHVWLADFSADDLAGVFVAADPPARAIFDERSRRLVPRDRDGDAPHPDGIDVFVRDHDLFVRDPSGEHRLTRDGTAEDSYAGRWHVSPDGTRAFGFQTAPAQQRELVLVESTPKDQVQPRVVRCDYLKPGDRIASPTPRLFDLVERRPVPIDAAAFADPWSIDRVRWSDDSREVFCLYNRRGHQVLRLCAIDATTGAVRAVVEETSRTFVDYSQKTFLHWLPGGRSLVWASERDGHNHLYLVNVASGAARQLTSGPWNVRRVERVDNEARRVWFTALGIHADQDPYHRHLARVGLDGGPVTTLTAADGTHEWEFSPDGRLFVDRWSRVDQPWVTELRRADDGALVAELGRDDAAELLAAGFRPPERFVAKGRDGTTDIHGIIIRPTSFAPGRRYPVIEDIYAGPQDHHVPKAWGFSGRQRALAECGFIVVQIDGMGTNWRGKAFHDVCYRNLKDGGLPDRIAWLKAAAARHPEMDLDRVGIYGGSAGGQNALAALLHHGDFYDAAVADCGCHDNRLDKVWWNEAWMGWPVGPHYAENSNVTHAARLRGRLLLTVGELDTNVDPASTLQVAKALIDAGKDFECLVVPGGGHGVGETPYLVRRRQEFFVRALQDPRREP